jgi:hypothetical protein
MDKLETPLRIQSLDPASLLSDWHWFFGPTTLGKPVELLDIPDGTHILQKPWDRMLSQQGNLDWFCFWLKGEEDPDPTKAEQYARRRELRGTEAKLTLAQGQQHLCPSQLVGIPVFEDSSIFHFQIGNGLLFPLSSDRYACAPN